MAVVKVFLKDADVLALQRLAESDHRSRASLLRVIVDEYLQAHGAGYLFPEPEPEPEPAIPDAAIDDDIEKRVKRAAQKKVGE